METDLDYIEVIKKLETRGKDLYGARFSLSLADRPALCRLICYFLKDEAAAEKLGIRLDKGIMITGPVGCGKTTLMNLVRFLQPVQERFILKSCRDVSFEFIKDGYEIISRYSHQSFHNYQPKNYCFDDLGTENSLKFFGNECNIMAELLLSRYDLFITRRLITHLTTNLSASEIESMYGNRVRSRMRELFNLVVMNSADKRK